MKLPGGSTSNSTDVGLSSCWAGCFAGTSQSTSDLRFNLTIFDLISQFTYYLNVFFYNKPLIAIYEGVY